MVVFLLINPRAISSLMVNPILTFTGKVLEDVTGLQLTTNLLKLLIYWLKTQWGSNNAALSFISNWQCRFL